MHRGLSSRCYCSLEVEPVLQPVSGLIVGCFVCPCRKRCGGVNLQGLANRVSSLSPALVLTPVPRVKMGSAPSPAVVEGGRGCCADEMVGVGNLSGSCSSCLEIQIAANLSSLERNCGWQFQCFSRFDAPVCFRREERAWRESNWASVSGNEG